MSHRRKEDGGGEIPIGYGKQVTDEWTRLLKEGKTPEDTIIPQGPKRLIPNFTEYWETAEKDPIKIQGLNAKVRAEAAVGTILGELKDIERPTFELLGEGLEGIFIANYANQGKVFVIAQLTEDKKTGAAVTREFHYGSDGSCTYLRRIGVMPEYIEIDVTAAGICDKFSKEVEKVIGKYSPDVIRSGVQNHLYPRVLKGLSERGIKPKFEKTKKLSRRKFLGKWLNNTNSAVTNIKEVGLCLVEFRLNQQTSGVAIWVTELDEKRNLTDKQWVLKDNGEISSPDAWIGQTDHANYFKAYKDWQKILRGL